MKILLKDGTTIINQVIRVDEKVMMGDDGPTPSLQIQVDIASGLSSDDLINLHKTIGMDKISVLNDAGEKLVEYEIFTKLATVHTTYTERSKHINLTFTRA